MSDHRLSFSSKSDRRSAEKRRSSSGPQQVDSLTDDVECPPKKQREESQPRVYDQPAPRPTAKELLQQAKMRNKAKQMLKGVPEKKETKTVVVAQLEEAEYVAHEESEFRKAKLAQVFNPDSDSEEEAMPFDAKIRMRNIGRDTPTAAGPNSFGKGALGFTNISKLRDKQFKETAEELNRK